MVMAVQGAGAALSPALGGWLAQGVGYRSAFLILGALSIGSLLLWLGSASWLKPACAANSAGA
jgi:MFS family permease